MEEICRLNPRLKNESLRSWLKRERYRLRLMRNGKQRQAIVNFLREHEKDSRLKEALEKLGEQGEHCTWN